MKKLRIIGFAVIVVAMLMAVGCDPNVKPEHIHTFSEEWSGDETYHWHAATCDDTDEAKDKAKHTWDDGEVTKEPTCTEAGEKTYKCTVCGRTKTAEYKKALGHKSDGGEVTKEPTCTEAGEKIYKCAVCGELVKKEEVAALGHDWEIEIITPKTCTTKGERKLTCRRCNETKEETIPAGHTWDAGVVIVAATTEADGEKTYTCTVCKETRTEAIPALGAAAITVTLAEESDYEVALDTSGTGEETQITVIIPELPDGVDYKLFVDDEPTAENPFSVADGQYESHSVLVLFSDGKSSYLTFKLN